MVPGSVLVPHSEAGVWTSVVVAGGAVAVAGGVEAAVVEAGVAASPGPGTWRRRT